MKALINSLFEPRCVKSGSLITVYTWVSIVNVMQSRDAWMQLFCQRYACMVVDARGFGVGKIIRWDRISCRLELYLVSSFRAKINTTNNWYLCSDSVMTLFSIIQLALHWELVCNEVNPTPPPPPDKYAIKQIKIFAQYRDILSGLLLTCQAHPAWGLSPDGPVKAESMVNRPHTRCTWRAACPGIHLSASSTLDVATSSLVIKVGHGGPMSYTSHTKDTRRGQLYCS